MDERVIKFRVGVVVVAAASITVILVIVFGALPNFRPQYTLHVQFPEAPGVAVDTPVRKSGVRIGRVSGVRLLDQGGVVVTMRIDERFTLRQNEISRIATGSLVTGDAVVEWVRAPTATGAGTPLTDGEFLANGQVQRDPLGVLVNLERRMSTAFGSIENAAQSISVAGEEVAVLVGGLNATVGNNEDQLRRIMQKTEGTLDSLQTTMTSIQDVVGDPQVRDGLQSSLRQLPQLFDETRETLRQARQAVASFQVVGERADRNLANLERFTEPLAENSDQLIGSLRSATDNLDSLLAQLVEFSDSLNNSQGTIGKLVHDRELYDRLNHAAANVEDLTRQLQPIVKDVRIFTDKIARDPRQLGVKGALDRRPSGFGFKNLPAH